jgi:hypothetical protein
LPFLFLSRNKTPPIDAYLASPKVVEPVAFAGAASFMSSPAPPAVWYQPVGTIWRTV